METNSSELKGEKQASGRSSLPRTTKALQKAKASAKSAKQKMRDMKKNTSGVNLLRKSKKANGLGAVANNISLAGFMYKRRSGMTGLAASLFHQGESWTEKKFGGRLWILRYFILRNGVISYYDVPKHIRELEEQSMRSPEGYQEIEFHPDPGSERGYIELGRTGVQVRMSFGHSSQLTNLVNGLPQGEGSRTKSQRNLIQGSQEEGSDEGQTDSAGHLPQNGHLIVTDSTLTSPTAKPSHSETVLPSSPYANQGGDTRSPSPFQLEIVYNNMLNPKEWQSWTLCAMDRKAFFRWTSAITSVIYAPRGPGGVLLHHSEESDEEIEYLDPSQIESSANVDLASPRTDDSGEAYLNHDDDADLLEPNLNDFQLDQNQYNVDVEETHQRTSISLRSLPLRAIVTLKDFRMEVATALCISNLITVARNQMPLQFAISVLTLAIVLVIWKLQDLDSNNRGAANATKEVRDRKRPIPAGVSWQTQHAPKSLRTKTESSSQPSTSPANRDGVQSGSPVSAPSSQSRSKRVGGLTLPYIPLEEITEKKSQHCWTTGDDSVLNVRVGPDYKINKQKAPTKPALFRTIGIDLFESEKKINEVARKVVLPFDKCVDPARISEPFPVLLIFNFQLPRPGGSSFSSADGPGYNFSVYYTPSEEMIELSTKMNEGKFVEPSIRLLRRWFDESETNPSIKERLKLVGFILNPDECGMPGWTQGFNGKPVMIKKSGIIYHDRQQRVFEMDIDLRQWGFMTRKGISALLPGALAKMEFIVSFVIQGEENDELPERVMVASQVSYLHTDKACELAP